MNKKIKRKIGDSHINAIKEYISRNFGRYFTVWSIQKYLKEDYPELAWISDWVVRYILRKKLKYSYKKLSLMKKKLFKEEQIRKFIESALVQLLLNSKGYELMFLDELSINFRQKSIYEWGPIGDNWFQQVHEENFAMSFMIGFSIKRTYGLLGTTVTHTSESFISFINNSLEYRAKSYNMEDQKLMIIWDKASIHKSKEVKIFLRNIKVHVLTILLYSPALNPAEKMILFIKQKLSTLKHQGR